MMRRSFLWLHLEILTWHGLRLKRICPSSGHGRTAKRPKLITKLKRRSQLSLHGRTRRRHLWNHSCKRWSKILRTRRQKRRRKYGTRSPWSTKQHKRNERWWRRSVGKSSSRWKKTLPSIVPRASLRRRRASAASALEKDGEDSPSEASVPCSCVLLLVLASQRKHSGVL